MAAGQRKERKVVTVVFADLVGFTARAETLDPEDVEAILRPYHQRLRDELERFGGTVEKFIGDAVMAVFGAPVVHEDDPERAVRAALAIRDWALEDEGMQVRVAVNTGEALVSVDARPEAGEAMVAGDVVNTAARLQSAAPVNAILVGEATHRATERMIDYREAGPVEAKGKSQPVAAWEVVSARGRTGVELAPSRVELVGRTRELELLTGALARVRDENAPQLLTLVGVPGIGKSRLVRELFEVVREDPELITWRQGRSLPYGEGVTFWALAEMVKAETGILESDSREEVDAKLRRAVGDICDEGESEWVVGHLRPLVGAEQVAETRGDTRAEAFAAWRRFLEALGDRGPAVLVFEDLHWADDGLFDFVDHLIDWATGVPLLLVCTARPELLTRRPGWGGGKLNATTVTLPPLSSEETARLVHALLHQAVLPADVQATLLERAGGNPLYAEEFARIAAAHGSAADLPLPESIQGLIAARVDALTAAEKLALEHAAVVGKVFWAGSVAALGEAGGVDEALHSLTRKEFVQRERRSSVAGEHEYAFRHGLVRDVAYGQIPRARRADLHRAAAAWIEALGRPEDYAELLAHHYLSALEYARAAGQDVAGLAGRARPALREAGDRAAALNAFVPAARFYRAALELWPADDADRYELLLALGRAEEQVLQSLSPVDALEEARDGLLALGRVERAAEAEVLLADLRWLRGETEAARAHLDRAAILVADSPASPAKALVLGQLSRFHMLASRYDESLRFGEEAVGMATVLGLEELRGDALGSVAAAHTGRGDPGAIEELEESIEILERRGSVQALRGYNNLIHTLIEHGQLERAESASVRAVAEAERFGYIDWLRWIREKRGQLEYLAGRWDQVAEQTERVLAEMEAGRPHYLEPSWRSFTCLMLLARGEREQARAESLRALESARQLGEPQMLQPTLAVRLQVCVELDDRDGAELLDELLDALRERMGLRSFYWEHLATAALELGRSEDFLAVARTAPLSPWIEAATAVAQRDFLRAAEIYGTVGARPLEAGARLRAAEERFAAGSPAEGEAEVAQALAFWRSVGATGYLNDAQALAAAS
jgi:class 3 adenylate cyclase/tetratricopeptide (TPR) repeat protein